MKTVVMAAGAAVLSLLLCESAWAQAPAHPVGRVEAVPSAGILRMDPGLDAVIAPGTRIERIATGFDFVEGPMWRKGALWFSDLRGNKMYKVTPDGKLTMLLDHSGGLPGFVAGANKGSNAMVTDKDGTVLMNQHGARDIVRLDDQMEATVFLAKYEGKQLNAPNDLVFTQDGALWITDPPYAFFDPAHPDADLDKNKDHALPFNAVWRYKDGKLTPIITDLPRPNGIGFSPDGKTLYISNTEPRAQLYKYSVGADGKLTNKTLFADWTGQKGIGVPDGLKVDSAGNVWASGPGGMRIIAPSGKVLGQLDIPEVVANIAWGGPDQKTAYLTGSSSIYKLSLKTPGEKPLYVQP